jgi:hypothetical protein
MTKMIDLIGYDLKWVQPNAFKMEYELRTEDTVVATLNFRSSFGSFATASSAEGIWTFKRVGFWKSQASVRASGAETDLALFKNNTWSQGGTLELPDGRTYPANSNFWSTQDEFKTNTGEPLISYKKINGIFHMSSAVEIHPLAGNIAELSWMVSFGWYLTVMMYMESAAAATATIG